MGAVLDGTPPQLDWRRVRRPFNLALWLRPLLATVVLGTGFHGHLGDGAGTLSVTATRDCSGVTDWDINPPATNQYFFVKTGAGGVSSFNGDGSDPFGTVEFSVSGASFHAYDPYLASYAADCDATFDGTLAANCTIGQTTPPGKWTSNHGSVGIFLASPFDPPPAKFDVSGTVTGPDGKPVAGVVIDVRNASGVVVANATTDGDQGALPDHRSGPGGAPTPSPASAGRVNSQDAVFVPQVCS